MSCHIFFLLPHFVPKKLFVCCRAQDRVRKANIVAYNQMHAGEEKRAGSGAGLAAASKSSDNARVERLQAQVGWLRLLVSGTGGAQYCSFGKAPKEHSLNRQISMRLSRQHLKLDSLSSANNYWPATRLMIYARTIGSFERRRDVIHPTACLKVSSLFETLANQNAENSADLAR